MGMSAQIYEIGYTGRSGKGFARLASQLQRNNLPGSSDWN